MGDSRLGEGAGVGVWCTSVKNTAAFVKVSGVFTRGLPALSKLAGKQLAGWEGCPAPCQGTTWCCCLPPVPAPRAKDGADGLAGSRAGSNRFRAPEVGSVGWHRGSVPRGHAAEGLPRALEQELGSIRLPAGRKIPSALNIYEHTCLLSEVSGAEQERCSDPWVWLFAAFLGCFGHLQPPCSDPRVWQCQLRDLGLLLLAWPHQQPRVGVWGSSRAAEGSLCPAVPGRHGDSVCQYMSLDFLNLRARPQRVVECVGLVWPIQPLFQPPAAAFQAAVLMGSGPGAMALSLCYIPFPSQAPLTGQPRAGPGRQGSSAGMNCRVWSSRCEFLRDQSHAP